MYFLKIKDRARRIHFKNLEVLLKLQKFIAIHLQSALHYRKLDKNFQKKSIIYQVLKKKKKSYLSRIVRRCIFTNRAKSVRFLKVSRLQARELISFGVVPGYKKAVW